MATPDFSQLKSVLKHCINKDSYSQSCLKSHNEALDGLIQKINLYETSQYEKITREEKISFWINSYIVWLLQILSDLPKEQKMLSHDAPELTKFKLVILGKDMSLRDIQSYIWSNFRDERLLFLMSEGTVSSPSIPTKVITKVNLDKVLNETIPQFIRNPANVLLYKRKLMLNPLFKERARWFVFNYGGSEGKQKKGISAEQVSVVSFLYFHADKEELKSGLEAMDFKIAYFPRNNTLRNANR